MFKVYYAGPDGFTSYTGTSRDDWDLMPTTGVQFLAVKLGGPEFEEETRVGWYQDDEQRRLFGDLAYYAWLPCDARPSGVTPDAVLDFWNQAHEDTSVRIADLSLDDLASIGVKCGRSISNEQFKVILEAAINDPEIP